MTDKDKKQQSHQKKMEKLKDNVDASIAAADTERGVFILLTGNGKGKSSSAFGMVMRALGYGYKVGVVQFIKGVQLSGEELYIRDQCPQVTFHQMGPDLPGILRIALRILPPLKKAGRLPKRCSPITAIIWWCSTSLPICSALNISIRTECCRR